MPAPLAKGIIITVSVLVAAGLAAYENPQFREWIDKSRQKIAVALHSLGDDVHPRSRPSRQADPSTREEMSDVAEARRRHARAEIMEHGRIMEERRKSRRITGEGKARPGSFDSLVGDDGRLRKDAGSGERQAAAWTTSAESNQTAGNLAHKNFVQAPGTLHESVDSPVCIRHLGDQPQLLPTEADPFASRYEREMRTAWNIPAYEGSHPALSSHESESLLDFTPTSENAPDPDTSVPAISQYHQGQPPSQSRYFSATASTSSNPFFDAEPEYYYAHPQNPFEPAPPQTNRTSRAEIDVTVSSAASVAGSPDHVHLSELAESDDGVLSDFGDGMRTPASAWTDVGSTFSGEN